MNQEEKQVERPPEDGELIHYFLCSGEVEYIQGKREGFRHDPSLRYQKVSAVYRASNQGLKSQDLGRIQTMLQLNFLARYGKTHKGSPPEIQYMTLLYTSYIGTWTEKEFLAQAPLEIPVAQAAQASEQSTAP